MSDKEWNHTVGRTDDQRKSKDTLKHKEKEKDSRYKGKEIFITNYILQMISNNEQLELQLIF
jgi:DNA adenine methylase